MLVISKQLKTSVLIFIMFDTMLLINGQHLRSDYWFYEEIQGWIKFHSVPATWRDALFQCQLEGAILASPLNNNFLAAIKNLTSNDFDLFIGIHSTVAKGDFVSVEGVPLSSIPIKWAPGTPNNCGNNESCLVLTKSGTIEDVECNEVFPYVCYRKTISYTICDTNDKEYVVNPKNGHCYKLHSDAASWPHAVATCWLEGGYLSIINSEDEANFLKILFDKYIANSITSAYKDVTLLGFYYADEKFSWKTLHGENLQEAGYWQFVDGEPNNSSSQLCGGLLQIGKLDKIWCHAYKSFICEKEPDCYKRLY